MIDDPCRNPGRSFIPFKGCCGFPIVGPSREEDREELQVSGLSLITPGIKNPVSGNVLISQSNANSRLVPCSAPNSQPNIRIGGPQVHPPHQQTSRKQRRCWSTELHRRFVNALQQLGGSQGEILIKRFIFFNSIKFCMDKVVWINLFEREGFGERFFIDGINMFFN